MKTDLDRGSKEHRDCFKHLVALLSLLLGFPVLAAQADEAALTNVSSEIFVDTYYAHDFANLPARKRSYTTQALYDDEPALNLGFLDLEWSSDEWRGRLAAQDGSSVEANYAGEPEECWQYVQEAYAGYRVSDRLWLDAGIYFSHIGPESWISRDNWTYTRSLMSEYSPYYQLGMKASYQWSETLSTQLHLLNGWQNISDDRNPALGMQVSYILNPRYTLTYNNFIGYEQGTRIFHDLILKYDATDRLAFIGAIDYGTQERAPREGQAWWYGFSMMTRYKIVESVALAGRVEKYRDPHQVILASETDNSFSALGLSAGIDVTLLPQLVWRTEFRAFLDNDDVFSRDEGFSESTSFVVTSLSYSYDLAGVF